MGDNSDFLALLTPKNRILMTTLPGFLQELAKHAGITEEELYPPKPAFATRALESIQPKEKEDINIKVYELEGRPLKEEYNKYKHRIDGISKNEIDKILSPKASCFGHAITKQDCDNCHKYNEFPYEFCCLEECGNHEFCVGCTIPKYIGGNENV